MKKYFFIPLMAAILLSANFVIANDFEQGDFIENFSDCVLSKFTDYNGVKDIKGWRAGKCIYEERDSYGQTTRCYFTNDQIEDIANTMKMYEGRNTSITLKYTNGTEDSFNTGSATIMDWTNYLNIPGVCAHTR